MASRALQLAPVMPATTTKFTARSCGRFPAVILHWLGEAFDPSLAGYWGSCEVRDAMETCLEIIAGESV